MTEQKTAGDKPDPKKLEALRSLPKEVLNRLTKEEIQVFLGGDDWPDSLKEKLGEYLVDS